MIVPEITSFVAQRHADIAAKPLDQIAGGHLSNDEIASKVRMLMRDDLYHEAVCMMSRDRIVWLAGALAALHKAALPFAGRNSSEDTFAVTHLSSSDVQHLRAVLFRVGGVA